MIQNLEEVLTTREAAAVLNVSLRTVQLWVESGALKAWKTPGGHRKVTRASINELLSSRKSSVSSPKPRGTSKRANFSILIVEDDAALRNLLYYYFNSWKVKVDISFAANGFEGLITLGKERPDLLITDLMMPGMDGFEMIHHLKNTEAYQDLHIIVTTALDQEEILSKGGLPEDIKLFRKPISFEAIEEAVASVISIKAGKTY